MKPIFERLLVWRDPVRRSGPVNMAVDEALLETLGTEPVLRVYDWAGDWVSLGYFQDLSEAVRLFGGEEMAFVRRLTGGGIVDHRMDLTYTVLVPRGMEVSEARGDESYRLIHAGVVEALARVGVAARMLTEDDANGSAACFEQGVAWDVVDGNGQKLAGAGQKRSREGLLHEGSVLVPEEGGREALERVLPGCLAGDCRAWEPAEGLFLRAAELERERYGTPEWLGRR